jgi:hypothetical protein
LPQQQNETYAGAAGSAHQRMAPQLLVAGGKILMGHDTGQRGIHRGFFGLRTSARSILLGWTVMPYRSWIRADKSAERQAGFSWRK